MGNKKARAYKAYDAWLEIAAERRPIPHIKVIVGHAGKKSISEVNGGHLAAFEQMHGIPVGTLTLEYTSRRTLHAVKENLPGSWNASQYQPPSEISGYEMAYFAQVNNSRTPAMDAYNAWLEIAAERRPIPHIKVIAGYARKIKSADLSSGDLAAFQERRGIPAGTLVFERNRLGRPAAVTEENPGAWNRALRAVPSAAADSLVTGYGHPPRSDAAPAGYYPNAISSNYSTNTSYNPRRSTPAEAYTPNPDSYYPTAHDFAAQQPAISAPAIGNEEEADAFLDEFFYNYPGNRTPATAYGPPTSQPPIRTTDARFTAPADHQPLRRRMGR
ncbi:hypothetical protein RJT17_35640 [Streptomyces sp. P5-A9]|uniref:hypothetical protein n=1 Tax=Streptomyces sp. P5-A9 TaxID=3071730 RepID=UPI002FC7B1CF